MKKTMSVLLITGVCFINVNADPDAGLNIKSYYSVSGNILLKGISRKGSLYILLVTEQIFKTPLQYYKKIILPIGDKEIKEKKIVFKFAGIPTGKYGIRCFLDEDGNGKLNKGLLGPAEPWGMSWQGKKPSGWPVFKNIAFDVNKEVKNIIIVIQ